MKILFVSHELTRTGAPKVLLNFLIWIKSNYPKIKTDLITLEGGDLENDFKLICHKIVDLTPNIFEKLIFRIKNKVFKKNYFYSKTQLIGMSDYDLIYANTSVSLNLAMDILKLSKKETKLVAHIHEIKSILNLNISSFEKYKKNINHFIAVSELVKNNLSINAGIDESEISVVYPPSNIELKHYSANKVNFSFTVGGSGYGHWVKGFDIFLKLAVYIKDTYSNLNIDFTWVGNLNEEYLYEINREFQNCVLSEYVKLIGEQIYPHDYFRNFDVFVLTSREDSFPLVCIENGMLEKPIICFEGASGTQEILQFGGGFIVPYLDIEAMAEKIIYYYNNRDLLIKDGQRSKELFSQFTPENQYPKNFEVISKALNLP